MTARATSASLRIPACLCLGLALPACAIGLGELQVHSFLGEPLDATVAIAAAPDARPRRDCLSLGRARASALPALPRATLDVEADGAGWRVRLRTRAAIGEPALQLRLDAACGGQDAASRDYEILLDPRPAEASPPASRALPGDTLASLAAAIHPQGRALREAYVQALRAANPALAGLAPDEPFPRGAEVVLPDLRRFSLSIAVPPASPRANLRVATRHAAADAPKQPPVSRRADMPKPRLAGGAAVAAGSGRFVLRLAAPELDLSRSRGIDDRARAQLRDRLLVLDADDQVAALLSLRNSVKQLEGRVTELQLKLSVLPAASSAAVPAPQASPVPSPAPLEPEKSAPPVVKPPPSAPRAPETPPGTDELPSWLWGVLALFLAAIAATAWRALARTRKKAPAPASELDEAEILMRGDAGGPAQRPLGEHRFVAESDASLSTIVPSADPAALRRRYIEERFPEIVRGTIVTGEPDSVVKAARLFYEDGAITRAIELLQFAVEENPAPMKPWLALFEIFRLEGRAQEFAELAGRFREHHQSSDNWRKVQYIGREIDPRNPLFREAPFDNLETIGYPASKNRSLATFDPLAENWLNAPMDFTTDALASSLRAGVLADAGVTDADLVADPMPALKNAEMFNVA